MGLMDKFKNLFTDEEIIEEEENEPIEIKEIKKEEEVHQLPTFMREKIAKEEHEKQEKELKMKNISDSADDLIGVKKELKLESILEDKSEIKKEEGNAFKFPIDLEDNDFIETRSRQALHSNNREKISSKPIVEREVEKEDPVKKEPVKTKVSEIYKDKRKEEKIDKKFRATPIISPIYGVLDKNYTPNDMECSKGENLETHRHSKSVDFDSVRKKAYGSLTQEIKENLMCENCEYLKEAKECKREKEKRERTEVSSLVYDVLEDNAENSIERDITLDEAAENYYDYGVEYQKKLEEEPIKIVNHEEQEEPIEEVHYKKEIPPVKSSINLLSTLKKSMGEEVPEVSKKEKNLELTDDLFNLIDSMYDERNDSK